jgi:hypothetical protein
VDGLHGKRQQANRKHPADLQQNRKHPANKSQTSAHFLKFKFSKQIATCKIVPDVNRKGKTATQLLA